ncbi:NAD-dependent dehydratase [Sulfuricella sp. T08]|uniref:hypothetical protein n=1 Tax=Sulfuricella sp. T08 TaxID=1632857 RepID=UPI0006179E55|nr:hypothetical protein [Sulfuricella sp. T08]GAO34779.1 NAD-dependent dehydratase [Sulfuricella sp. T08]
MLSWLHKGCRCHSAQSITIAAWLHFDNLIDLIVICLEHPAAANQTFLVSDREDLSTTELLRRMVAALNVQARLIPVPQKLLEMGFKAVGKSDLAQRLCGSLRVDNTKACTMLDWKSLISVDEGLRRTAQGFRALLRASNDVVVW